MREAGDASLRPRPEPSRSPGGGRLGPTLLLLASPLLAPATSRAQLPAGFQVQPVLAIGSFGNEPASIAFTPAGDRLFFNLRSGEIRILDVATSALLPAPFATVSVTSVDERGLLGLALDPDFSTNGFVYVWLNPAGPPLGRVLRFTDVGNVGQNPTIVLDNLPQGTNHNGGFLRFGPDGFLYASLGDQSNAANAQNPATLPGKIHRIDKGTGGPAPGNPFGNTIYSLGLRNNWGFAFSPVTGVLFETEPGPATTDELNRIPGPGANMGWPTELGPGPNPALVDPLFVYPGVPTGTGIDFYYGSNWPAAYVGDLFTIEWSTGALRRFELGGAPDTQVASQSAWIPSGARGFALAMGPDGALWFSTETGISRIVYVNPLPDVDLGLSGSPQVGQAIAVHVVHGDANWYALLAVGFGTIPPLPLPWGTLTIDAAFVLSLGAFGPHGVRTILFAVPPDPALAGVAVYFQGAEILDATTGNMSSSLAVTLVP